METIITGVIVAAAVIYLIAVFRKRAKGQGGCQCASKCGNCTSAVCDPQHHK